MSTPSAIILAQDLFTIIFGWKLWVGGVLLFIFEKKAFCFSRGLLFWGLSMYCLCLRVADSGVWENWEPKVQWVPGGVDEAEAVLIFAHYREEARDEAAGEPLGRCFSGSQHPLKKSSPCLYRLQLRFLCSRSQGVLFFFFFFLSLFLLAFSTRIAGKSPSAVMQTWIPHSFL